MCLQKCPKYLVPFAILKNITFKVNTSVVIFGQPLKEIGLLYYLTFGHTVPKVVRTR